MTIVDVSKRFKIEIVIPQGQSLERTSTLLKDKGHNGTILFNLKPLFHMNVVHFAIFSYLKVFAENKYKCTIILQDLITASGDFLEEINTQSEANQAMDLIFHRLKKFGINLDYIEIIPESSLLRLYNRSQRKFFYDLIKLSSIADNFNPSPTIPVKSFEHIDSLCCFLYETFLQPNYIITGGNEINTVWHNLRKRGNLNKMLGSDYNSPIMLVVPNIYKYSCKELISTLDKNDPFYENFSQLTESTTFINEYIEKIKILNAEIKLTGDDNPINIINCFRQKMYY